MEAHAAGTDIIIKEGLANGRALLHPKLLELSQKLNCSPDQLALGAILAQPFEPRVLSGAVTIEQLRSNLGALCSIDGEDNGVAESAQGVAERLTSTNEGMSVLKDLMEGCCMKSEEYWKDRSALKWN